MAGRLVVDAFTREFQKTRQLSERAIAQLSDAQLHTRLDAEANSVAMLMQHLAGNMRSRWTDFLTTDGEKPWRQRDAEFEPPVLTRDALMVSWQSGWQTLFDTLATLTDDDLTRTVTIRGEGQPVLEPLGVQPPLTSAACRGVATLRIVRLGETSRKKLGQDVQRGAPMFMVRRPPFPTPSV